MKQIDIDVLKKIKKKQREEELFDENGWKQNSKVQKSEKHYTRKTKHKKF